MHTRRFEKQFWYKCPKPGCKSSFNRQGLLDEHLRIHNNDLGMCMYCPYRYLKYDQYQVHLKAHFKIREFKCDQCDAKFSSLGYLNHHYQKHEGFTYSCSICKNYETNNKINADTHLRKKHADIFGNNVNASDIQRHMKIK